MRQAVEHDHNIIRKSRLSLIVRVNVVLNRTVVVDRQQQSYSGTQPTFEMAPGFKPLTILSALNFRKM